MRVSAKDLLSSGNRDKVEIMAAALALTQKPNGVTRILSNLNINHKMVTNYLKFMIERRLIETQGNSKTSEKTGQVYQATEKGLLFLKTYCELMRLLYGEDFMQNKNNLAVVCLQYCKESEST